jgi:uncharacterized protein (TIGR01244 family)
MRFSRALRTVIALVLFGTPIVVAAQESRETLPGAANYTRVDATVACGGVTSPEAIAELKRRGFVSVINLRELSEPGVADEAAVVEKAGMRYLHIPLNSAKPETAPVDRFLAAVADRSNQPVYIHCGSANRVGAVWAIKRALQDGWTTDKALAEAEAIGLRSPVLRQFALDYISAHR